VADHEHDVLVIGSGAGGGMAAYVLTQSGLKVHMLEAGRDYDPASETAMFSENRDAPLLGTSTPDKEFGFYNATIDGGWQIEGEPYSTAAGTDFQWWRSRMLGGRTNHWARNSFRMGEFDFKPRTRDGLGFDWPMTYQEMAPWYDRTEKLIGVYGANSGLTNHRGSRSRYWNSVRSGSESYSYARSRRWSLTLFLGDRLWSRVQYWGGVSDNDVTSALGSLDG